MFKLFKNKNDVNVLFAPVTGKVIPLEKVTDKVFSSKVMGEGVAFKFDGDTVHSPCDGKISMIAETLHAFGIQMDNGIEILIHIGLDTVALNGKGFESLVSVGKKVKVGTPIIKVDRKIMSDNNIDLTTPMIITEQNGYNLKILTEDADVIYGESKVVEFE